MNQRTIISFNRMLPFGILLLLVVATFPACRDAFNECLSGPGAITTQRIGLYPFKNVKVMDNISLNLKNGNSFEMEVHAGKNIIPMLGIQITNGTLNLRNNSTCPMLKDPWKAVEITLIVPELDTIFVENYATIKSDIAFETDELIIRISESPSKINLNVNCNYLRLENFNGTSEVRIFGLATISDVYHAGYGTVDFRDLISEEVYINSNSSNDCYIRAGDQYLFAVIDDKGNIYYHNDPQSIDVKLEGTGNLIKVY